MTVSSDRGEAADDARSGTAPSRLSPADAFDLVRQLAESAQRLEAGVADSAALDSDIRERLQSIGIRPDSLCTDVPSLADVLCRLLTGESLAAFARSPTVKRQVPRSWQGLLERALGGQASKPIHNVEEFLQLLESSASDTATQDISPTAGPTHAVDSAPAHEADRTIPHPDVPFPVLAHYEVVQRLGRGGMGEVYLAFEPALDRTVALKVLPRELARSPEFMERFRAEASAAAKLQHPNIVPIHFIGEDAGHLFFAMQHVDGESLAQRLHRQPKLPVDEVVPIIRQVLTGLAAAHRRGLIHRDIKPGNILIDRETERVLIADFGLAKSFESSIAGRTAAGVVMGTVDYIAPEQGRGLNVDARSDLYSVGVLMYQMLAGRLPFSGDGPAVLIFQHVYEPPPPLKGIAPEIPGNLAAVVETLLAKKADHRFQSADEVLAALDAVAAGQPIPRSSRPSGSLIKRLISWPVAALLTIVLIGIGAEAIRRNVRSPDSGGTLENGRQKTEEAPAKGAALVTQDDQPAKQADKKADEQASPEAETKPETETKLAPPVRPAEVTYGNSEASGFRDAIHSMAFKPFYDGEVGFGFALASEDGSLSFIRRLHRGNLERYGAFGGRHSDGIEQIAFSPDGSRIAAAGSDGAISIWKLVGGRQIRRLAGHTQRVTAIRFSPDSQMLLSGSPDGTVRLWNILEEREVKRVPTGPYTSAVRSLSWSADGSRFLVGADVHGAKSLSLWDVESGRQLEAYDTLNSPSRDVFLFPDGRELAAVTREVVKIWQIDKEAEVRTFGTRVRVAEFTFDGRLALTANADQSLTLWNVADGQAIAELEGPGAPLTSIAISRDGRVAARARDDGTLRMIDLPSAPRLVKVFENHTGPVTSVAVASDTTGAIAAGTDGKIAYLHPGDWSSSSFHPVALPLSTVAYSPDASHYLYATSVPASKTNVVGLIDRRRPGWQGDSRQFSGFEDVITSAGFSGDGRSVAAGSLDGTVRVWEVQTEIEKRVFHPGVPVYCVALSPIGTSLLLAGGADRDLWLWDLNAESGERRLSGHTSHVLAACFTSDGQFAVTAGVDRTVRIWDIKAGSALRVLSGHADRVNSVAVSKDGRLVLSASDDRTVRVWNFDTGKPLAVLAGHIGAVRSVAISLNGLWVLSGSDDRTSRLWDLTGLAE